MNIKDTISTMEYKLQQIDALFDASMDAEKAGERFKAHGIAKDAEKIADELEKWRVSKTSKSALKPA